MLSPFDLIPEFLPIIAPLDDIVVLRYAASRIPPGALIDAWPAERRILEPLAPATAAAFEPIAGD